MNTLFKELPLPAGIPTPLDGFAFVGVPEGIAKMPQGCLCYYTELTVDDWEPSSGEWDIVDGFVFAAPFRMVERLPKTLAEAVNPALGEPFATQDKLCHLFTMQRALNARCGVNTDNLSDDDKAKWVLQYTRAMSQEIAELVDSVPWKFWAKYQKFDEQNAKVEVVDLFHFLISIAQVLGMTAEDVHAAYVAKNAVNHARQDAGYKIKDEADSKHI